MINHPQIIQGGMGVAVSGWLLARAVSELGQLGVVSGTALAVTVARRLQLGDPDGQLRKAFQQFPVPAVVDRVLEAYYIPSGKSDTAAFRLTPMPVLAPGRPFLELTVLANFAEVYLAKEGHRGVVGLNLLEKIQLPTLPSLFGAMLAGVDYILMGAGIPRMIPGALDRLSRWEPAQIRIDVKGTSAAEEFHSTFDPVEFMGGLPLPELKRPFFLGIVGSATLAMTLAKKSNGQVDGFIVEGDTAGGHNAPPRGAMQLNAAGEPIYGPRDVPDLEKIRALGLPFWLAGSYGRPGRLRDALAAGATGIQVGTAFAFCEESGILPEIKDHVLALSQAGVARVFTDPVASPTGFPFKVLELEGTISDEGEYAERERICDLGYLRHLYLREDGSVGYRCPAEPIADYLEKGGMAEETTGRKCVCNGLPATVGLGQVRSEAKSEPALVTAGNDISEVAFFVKAGQKGYRAADVIRALLQDDGVNAGGKVDAGGDSAAH